MRIAVIVPAFNVASFLHDTLRSVVNQTHADWTMIVVDDGSTDATAEVAAAFHDHRIHLIRQENAGVSAARNRAIQAAIQHSPDAFLFLDGDDRLALDSLALLADTLDASPWAVAACGRYACFADTTVTRVSRVPPNGCVLERLLIRNLFANGGHLLIRREAVEAAGDFRLELCYGEDWEYWTRIALLGEFAAVPSGAPMLFVRDRPSGAYRSNAANPAAYRPAMDAIYRNPAFAERLGASRVAYLRHRAEAETAWAVGRELIRLGQRHDGRHWLGRSIRSAPSTRRLALMALAWFRFGPFRPYTTVA